MNVRVISESGHAEALFGLGLSYGLTSDLKFDKFRDVFFNDIGCNTNINQIIFTPSEAEKYRDIIERLEQIAKKNGKKDGGHNKFLESICVWIDITAPRYWWQQMDSYRIGITKQSESTIRILPKQYLKRENFEGTINLEILNILNSLIKKRDIFSLKRNLPESYLQRRIIATNYKTLRGIILQREKEFLKEWESFIDTLKNNLIKIYWII